MNPLQVELEEIIRLFVVDGIDVVGLTARLGMNINEAGDLHRRARKAIVISRGFNDWTEPPSNEQLLFEIRTKMVNRDERAVIVEVLYLRKSIHEIGEYLGRSELEVKEILDRAWTRLLKRFPRMQASPIS